MIQGDIDVLKSEIRSLRERVSLLESIQIPTATSTLDSKSIKDIHVASSHEPSQTPSSALKSAQIKQNAVSPASSFQSMLCDYQNQARVAAAAASGSGPSSTSTSVTITPMSSPSHTANVNGSNIYGKQKYQSPEEFKEDTHQMREQPAVSSPYSLFGKSDSLWGVSSSMPQVFAPIPEQQQAVIHNNNTNSQNDKTIYGKKKLLEIKKNQDNDAHKNMEEKDCDLFGFSNITVKNRIPIVSTNNDENKSSVSSSAVAQSNGIDETDWKVAGKSQRRARSNSISNGKNKHTKSSNSSRSSQSSPDSSDDEDKNVTTEFGFTLGAPIRGGGMQGGKQRNK